MAWVTAIELWLGAVLVCLIGPIIWLYGRRRWLTRSGGSFDCALRRVGSEAAPWQLGMARYHGEYLEWFRVFSLGFRPRYRMRRTTMTVHQTRAAEPQDQLFGGEHVLTVEFGRDPRQRTVELAMDQDSGTGMLSWLEAAPPSIDRFRE